MYTWTANYMHLRVSVCNIYCRLLKLLFTQAFMTYDSLVC